MTDEMVTYEEIAALKARVADMLRAATRADHLLWGIYGYGSVSEQYVRYHAAKRAIERVMTSEGESVSPDLAAALRRLRWVVPGRDYGDLLIADVQEVLRHFGMYPYVAGH